jgi:7-carboxy-7-deazaguanine synthase
MDEESADVDALNDQLKWIMQRCQQDHWYAPSLLPQLHVMLWNNERAV